MLRGLGVKGSLGARSATNMKGEFWQDTWCDEEGAVSDTQLFYFHPHTGRKLLKIIGSKYTL